MGIIKRKAYWVGEGREVFFQKAILYTLELEAINLLDSKSKNYNKYNAIADEIRFLVTIAKRMWELIGFELETEDYPSFRNVIRETGFAWIESVRDYFRKRAAGIFEFDPIKDSNTENEWIKMLEMNKNANRKYWTMK